MRQVIFVLDTIFCIGGCIFVYLNILTFGCVFFRVCTRVYHVYFYFYFICGSVWVSYNNGSCCFSRRAGVYRCFPVIRSSLRQVIFVLDTIFCIGLTSFINLYFLSHRVVYIRCISVIYGYRYCICCAVCIGYFHSYRLIFTLCGDISRNYNRLHFILRSICCYCCCNFVRSCSLTIWLIHSAALCCIFLGICTSIYHIYLYFYFICGSIRVSYYNGSCCLSGRAGVYRSFPIIRSSLR